MVVTPSALARSTVYRTKRHFVEGNLERALNEEPRPGAKPKLTGIEEALLGATARQIARGRTRTHAPTQPSYRGRSSGFAT